MTMKGNARNASRWRTKDSKGVSGSDLTISGGERPRFREPTDGRAKGGAEEVSGAKEGGKCRRRTGAPGRRRGMHERLPSGQNAVYGTEFRRKLRA